ncbi:MAG: type II secretion system major pseudopilin GspG [Bdellovibrionaceae bacterium]|nr:type II secretion system major pseudopilin GspG [Pseudobdellovibrionaceae bacterium]
MFSRRLNQAGMTLIEIMIVLAIVGGLMAVLGNNIMDRLKKSRVNTTQIHMKEIQKQLDMYNADCGSYPTTEQGLDALVKAPGDSCPNWGPEPYMKKEPKDAWGKEYIYESDGATVSLKSLGADKREGGDNHDKDLLLEDI